MHIRFILNVDSAITCPLTTLLNWNSNMAYKVTKCRVRFSKCVQGFLVMLIIYIFFLLVLCTKQNCFIFSFNWITEHSKNALIEHMHPWQHKIIDQPVRFPVLSGHKSFQSDVVHQLKPFDLCSISKPWAIFRSRRSYEWSELLYISGLLDWEKYLSAMSVFSDVISKKWNF